MKNLKTILEGLFDQNLDSNMEDAELPKLLDRCFREMYTVYRTHNNMTKAQFKSIDRQLKIITKFGTESKITRQVLQKNACILYSENLNRWYVMTLGHWDCFHGFDVWPDAALSDEVFHIRYGFVHEKTISNMDLTHWRVNCKCYTFPQELFIDKLKVQNLR